MSRHGHAYRNGHTNRHGHTNRNGRAYRSALGSIAAVVALLVTAGCAGSGVYETTKVPATGAAPSAPAPGATSAPPPADCANRLASFAPDASASGGRIATIRTRGRLIAGVSADTLLLGSRNPVSGQIEGFDIEMLKAVSKAIFNDPNKIEFRVITTAQRLPVLTDDSVDIVARALTITCARWEQIAFSSEYYRAGQKVLVAKGSPVKAMEDLKGKKVCAPNGSTSMDKLRTFTGLIPVGSDTHTGCLVLFQAGNVDAITGDDTILAGLAAQDPYAFVVKAPAFTAEPYGLGISKKYPELVSLVNGVLEQMRQDGRWKAAYNTWLAEALGPAPAPPVAVYGRRP
jgi:polar amino acid transport system substrate-binding protein